MCCLLCLPPQRPTSSHDVRADLRLLQMHVQGRAVLGQVLVLAVHSGQPQVFLHPDPNHLLEAGNLLRLFRLQSLRVHLQRALRVHHLPGSVLCW